MNKKLQVFVSSTYTDLKEERQAAVEAILDAGHIPAGMELFKGGKSQMETIYKWIDDSDVYILIFGGRYGSIEEESGLSYTELEYKYALSKNMPVFAVVLNELYLTKKINSLGLNNVIEQNSSDKYHKFKEYVEKNVVKFISNIDELSTAIHSHLNGVLNNQNYNFIGWIHNNKKIIDTSEEMDSYIVDCIASAKKSIYHLSWKDFSQSASIRPNYKEYTSFQNSLLETITSKLEQGIFYKEIFTFYKRKERINKMNNLIKYDSYWCGFFESNEQIKKFPKLHFLIIDNTEVIFASYDYKGNYCSIFDKEIVNIMLSYFEESWSLCQIIKDYEGIHLDTYNTAISNIK